MDYTERIKCKSTTTGGAILSKKWLEGIGGLNEEEHGYACKGYDGAYQLSHGDFLLMDD